MSVEVKSGEFYGKIKSWDSIDGIKALLADLKQCNQQQSGQVTYNTSYEGNFELVLQYDGIGHVTVWGIITGEAGIHKLEFEFISDQTYVSSTIEELEVIAKHFQQQSL